MAVVLLVEDNDRFANAVTRSLAGHDVMRSTSVEGAIAILQAASVDCALIDLNLTDYDDNSGAEVLHYMRLNCPTVPRAVVTGSRLRGSIYHNMMQRYGVSEVVIKGDVERQGFGTQDLIEVVHNLLESGISSERSVAIEDLQSLVANKKSALSARLSALDDARRFGFRARAQRVGTRRARLIATIESLDRMHNKIVDRMTTCRGSDVAAVAQDLRNEILENSDVS